MYKDKAPQSSTRGDPWSKTQKPSRLPDQTLFEAMSCYATLTSLTPPYLTSCIPPWHDTTLAERLLLPLTPHWSPVIQGAWWTFFRWFRLTFLCSINLLAKQLGRHQCHYTYRHDIRFRIPTSIHVTLIGWPVPPRSKPIKRPHSGISHHQFGIQVRLRYRLVPLLKP